MDESIELVHNKKWCNYIQPLSIISLKYIAITNILCKILFIDEIYILEVMKFRTNINYVI